MSRAAICFLLVVSQLLAMLLALLGLETAATNPLGWFLLLVGVGYISGVALVCFVRREYFWDPASSSKAVFEERGDRSFWLITAGMIVPFFASPLEYRYLAAILPRELWMAAVGLVLALLGLALFAWARRALGGGYSGHVSVRTEQPLVRSGPYAVIRHPAYAGYLLMALGISLGYASAAGLASVAVLLLPAVLYRMGVEERMLAAHFGDAYRQYARGTRRLIPGVW